MVACPPPSALSKLVAPNGTSRQKVRWFRGVFYRFYLLEVQKNDQKDRLRKLCRKFPSEAQATYKANQKLIQQRQMEGSKLGALEKFYLSMNLIIQESISLPPTIHKKLSSSSKRSWETA